MNTLPFGSQSQMHALDRKRGKVRSYGMRARAGEKTLLDIFEFLCFLFPNGFDLFSCSPLLLRIISTNFFISACLFCPTLCQARVQLVGNSEIRGGIM